MLQGRGECPCTTDEPESASDSVLDNHHDMNNNADESSENHPMCDTVSNHDDSEPPDYGLCKLNANNLILTPSTSRIPSNCTMEC